MFKRNLALFVFLMGLMHTVAQSPLDAYKYIIIPKKFDFLKEENQYRVNSTTKYLFEQNGFKTLTQGEEYPEDLKKDPCLAARADILDESTVLRTKLYVLLFDCQDQEVYRSEMGKTGEKSWDKTYIYALNDAFTSFEEMDYSYDSSLSREQETAVAAKAPEKVISPETQPSAATAAAESAPAAVAAAAVTADQKNTSEEKTSRASEENEVATATSYGNDNVSFLLIAQGDKLVAYVSDNKNSAYKKGEMIGTLVKTSLPNVFRASWKHMDVSIDQTTAYFDDQGNLKIDVDRGGQIEVLTFVKE
jgi:hypothetical protein